MDEWHQVGMNLLPPAVVLLAFVGGALACHIFHAEPPMLEPCCPEMEPEPCPSSPVNEAALLGQLKECRTQNNACMEEQIVRIGSEKRAMTLWAACCMVDESYPEQCTDPRCKR